MKFMNWILEPWPWYIAGPLIAFTMFLLLYFGQRFGISSSFRHICSATGIGKKHEYFNYDWKAQRWNLLFVLGTIIGGFLTNQFLTPDDYVVAISPETVSDLNQLGIAHSKGLSPDQLFGTSALSNGLTWFILIIGGFMIGFGTRYAGGCTSGHAIAGLSGLQLPSLVATIGFFIGGLLMTHFLFPLMFR